MSRCCLALAVLVGLAHVAHADEKADCNYLEIAATSGNQPSIDPELKPLEKKLKKPPFSSWNVFHKLSGGAFVLQKLKAYTPHVQQGAASLLLRDRNDKRLELTITVDGPDGKRVIDTKLGLSVGDWLPLVNNVKDDGHILALTCK
jgi:hypothetical protein